MGNAWKRKDRQLSLSGSFEFRNKFAILPGEYCYFGSICRTMAICDPDISWEKTESFDLGLDANFLDNKLRFTGDYYRKTTKDMLLQLQIPMYLGFDNPNQNTGKMNTKGWEFEIGWNDKIGDLDYSVSANLSDFKSIMGDLGGTEFLGDQIKRKGSEFNEWY